jgi:hypothetical protein
MTLIAVTVISFTPVVIGASEQLFFKVMRAVFKLYHTENKLHFGELMMMSALYFCRRVAPLLIPSKKKAVFVLTPYVCLAEKLHLIPIVVFVLTQPSSRFASHGNHANYYTIDADNITQIVFINPSARQQIEIST